MKKIMHKILDVLKRIRTEQIINFFIDLYRWFKLHSSIVMPALIISVCFLVVLCGVIKSVHPKQSMRSQIAVSAIETRKIKQFNHIDTELSNLKNKLDTTNSFSAKNAAAINFELNKIHKQLFVFNAGKNMQQIHHDIISSHADLSVKISDLQDLVQIIKKQIMPAKYLSASVLPFKIISVDIRNGAPYAAVTVDGKSKLVGKNETINHWMLVSLDYATQQVIFRKNKQYVKAKVNL